MPGHWGPQLKFAGYDQLVVQGRSSRPVYLAIEAEKVRFEDAGHVWGADTSETTIRLHEEKEGREAEILCIGPAGENGVLFANVTHRFSWTADHVGLGYVFGSKNLKAIVLRGAIPVTLHNTERFLELCRSLREQISRNPHAAGLKDKGTFSWLGVNGGGLGIRNYNETSQRDFEERWATDYLKKYQAGRESCFSCPIHCGRISEANDLYFGGVHLESAWSLGPRLGIFDWEKTLRLYRACQLQGLDPSSMGSLISWIMDCHERGILSHEDLGSSGCHWGDEQASLRWIEQIARGNEGQKAFRQGSFRAARAMGKGSELVPHFEGMDLPVRDPRSSAEYTLSRALFPVEWDDLQSIIHPTRSDPSTRPQGPEGNGVLEKVTSVERLKLLADMNSLCPLVVARLPVISVLPIAELLSTATGLPENPASLRTKVSHTLMTEAGLLKALGGKSEKADPFPSRFFKDPRERDYLEKKASEYDPSKDQHVFQNEERLS
jgi:aldehyde:ferredoxin oxidoreductase